MMGHIYTCLHLHAHTYIHTQIIEFIWFGILYHYVVVVVRFNQSSYNINESSGIIQLLLILSNPSSFNETVSLINTDHTAKGM